MSKRGYKITILVLTCLMVWFVWKYERLRGQVVIAQFISAQASNLRVNLREANDVTVERVGFNSREGVLQSLGWYLDYHGHHTNALVGSGLLGFVEREREYVIRDSIAYLRSTSTNDWGDDPYRW